MQKTTTYLMTGLLVALAASGPLEAKSHKYRAPRATVSPQRQIACTVLGCQTIPAACYPKEEHSPSGIPTGFDQIVCPPGVWPF
jgi:hypothetical protein